ncbi:MAG: hypothetical protein KDA57_22435 [Planctomycetales bacterium]|nr:hypothetical protein [Planctomycetales bacterium]
MDIDIKAMALCQIHTEIGKGAAGEIIIQQQAPGDEQYNVIEIQPYYLPTFIAALQELLPKAK